MTWENIQQTLASNWIIGPGVFVLWVVVALALKIVLFRKIHKLAERTTTHYDNILIEAFSMPLNLIILFIGFSLVWKVLPMNESVEGYLHLFTIIVIVLSITFFVDRFVVGMLAEHDHRVPSMQLSKGVFQGMVRVVIYLLGVFILLDNVGVSITPLLASLGIGTLAVALALQSTLANFFSGLFVMMDKSIKVGDFVQLESGEMGTVDDIGWRASRIRLITNNHVIIPNSKLVDSVVTNYQAPVAEMYTTVECGVHYESNLEHVERVVKEVANEVIEEVEGTIRNTEPRFWYRMFDASSINFLLRVRCKDFISQFRIQHELIKRIHKRFNDEGIVIPYPLRTLDLQPKHEALLRELAGKA